MNGDKKTDVSAAWGGKWRVSFGGTSGLINTSSKDISDMRLGDFDGKADAFTTENQ